MRGRTPSMVAVVCARRTVRDRFDRHRVGSERHQKDLHVGAADDRHRPRRPRARLMRGLTTPPIDRCRPTPRAPRRPRRSLRPRPSPRRRQRSRRRRRRFCGHRRSGDDARGRIVGTWRSTEATSRPRRCPTRRRWWAVRGPRGRRCHRPRGGHPVHGAACDIFGPTRATGFLGLGADELGTLPLVHVLSPDAARAIKDPIIDFENLVVTPEMRSAVEDVPADYLAWFAARPGCDRRGPVTEAEVAGIPPARAMPYQVGSLQGAFPCDAVDLRPCLGWLYFPAGPDHRRSRRGMRGPSTS